MKNVLIVDDYMEMVDLISDILEPLDIEIDKAYNGKQAFEKLLDKEYALVITDNNMPVLSGLSLIENSKKIGISCKFLLITADSMIDVYRNITPENKPDSFLSKPFLTHMLFNIVEQLLE